MKTNFLNTLKHSMFLLLAILGTFAGFSQPTQSTIGGNKTPDMGTLIIIPIPYFNCEFDEIGGGSTGGRGTTSGGGQFCNSDAKTLVEPIPFIFSNQVGCDRLTNQMDLLTCLLREGDIGGGKSTTGGLISNYSLFREEVGRSNTGGGKGTSSEPRKIDYCEFESNVKSFSKDLSGVHSETIFRNSFL